MADDVVEIGPGGGSAGGRLVFQGTPAALWRADTASGRGFSATTPRPPRAAVRQPTSGSASAGASLRNLRDVDCEIPVGVAHGDHRSVRRGQDHARARRAAGVAPRARPDRLRRVRRAGACAPSPSTRRRWATTRGRTRRPTRRCSTASATCSPPRRAGRASEFTFNRAEGACPECEGMGAVEISLRYLAPVWVPCEACEGRRYRPEVLDATWSGLSIADVLACSVDDARALFAEHRAVTRILDTLREVGLGYVTLGPAVAEPVGRRGATRPARPRGDQGQVRRPRAARRADHRASPRRPRPAPAACSTGLTDNGCTVVVVEHQADVIAAADWRIDLGPGGGPDGGRLLHCGPPVAEKRATGDAARQATRPPAVERRHPRARRPRPQPAGCRRRLRQGPVHGRDGRVGFGQVVVGRRRRRRRGDAAAARVPVGVRAPVGARGPGSAGRLAHRAGADDDHRRRQHASTGSTCEMRRGPPSAGPATSTASSPSSWRAPVCGRASSAAATTSGGPRRRPKPRGRAPTARRAAVPIEPRHLMGSPAAICPAVPRARASTRQFDFDKWIVRPDAPICARLLRRDAASCRLLLRRGTGGNGSLRAFAERYGFDPQTTPWSELSDEARSAFLFGDPCRSRTDPSPVAWSGGRRGTGGMNHWAQRDLGGAGHRGVHRVGACDGQAAARPVPGDPPRRSRPQRPVLDVARRARGRARVDGRAGRRARGRRAHGRAAPPRLPRARSGSATSTSTGRPGRCRPARRSGSSWRRCSAAASSA